jgi:hypothetical protein
MNETLHPDPNSDNQNPLIPNRILTGVMLLLLGVFALAAQFTAIGVLALPAIGIFFLVWGLLARNAGLLIPGGVLSGVALGVWGTGTAFAQVSDEHQGGMFMLGFAVGWALISLFGLLIGERMVWPLIPGGIFAIIGGALVAGGPLLTLLSYAGKLWPLALIGIGLWLLLRARTPKTTEHR